MTVGTTLVMVAAVAAASCGEGRTGLNPGEPTQTISPVAKAYLDEMLGVMQANSINRKTIEWVSFQTQVFEAAGSARNISDTHGAIAVALRLLGDRHSTYFPREGGRIMNPLSRGCNAGGPSIPPAPTLPETIGYVRVPSTLLGGAESFAAGRRFAQSLQAEIQAADRANLAGWIVDLRGNNGGSQWPMLAGISPVLGDGVMGYAIDPNSTWEEVWYFSAGAFYLFGTEFRYIDAPYLLLKGQPKVAILTDRTVASAGEAVTIAFKARPATRSFGIATCGLTTGNEEYSLSDGGVLALAVSMMADRTKTTYGDSIQPDEMVSDPQQAVESAIAWLLARN